MVALLYTKETEQTTSGTRAIRADMTLFYIRQSSQTFHDQPYRQNMTARTEDEVNSRNKPP